MIPFRALVTALILGLVLTGCQSSEERAEEHYQSALALLAEGDLERATVEFRNVFRLNGNHTEARADYAAALRAAGQLDTAFGQYLRLVEQDPDHLEGRIALAEMALEASAWDEAARHGERAIALAPDDPRVAIIAASLAYSAAVQDDDATARRDAADTIAALAAETPDSLILQQAMIDNALRNGDMPAALAAIDAAIASDPENRALHDVRLSILAEQEDMAEIEVQLLTMIGLFPEDQALVGGLVRLYASQDQIAEAQAFLREQIAANADLRRDYGTALVQFLLQFDGPEAALAALSELTDSYPEETFFAMLSASIQFDLGEQEAAIAALQGLVEETEAIADRNDARVTLARMLAETGNAVGAQRLIEEVLEADGTQVEALKMQAGWLIERDQADEAIAALRLALEQNPQDAQAMTLMARAHQRNGNHELARDFLASAAEASGNAPAETLAYTGLLVGEERYLLAEEALITALRLNPGNLALLSQLGEVYLQMEDWPRAEGVEQTLAQIGAERDLAEATRAAAGLQAARLAVQGRTEDAVGVLEALAEDADDSELSVQVALVRARLAAGDTDGARGHALDLLAADPDNPLLMLMAGLTEAAAGDNDAAIARFRALVEAAPEAERGWIELIRALYAQGDIEAAEAALAEGLGVLPDALNLLWAQAGFLERSGDIDGAIAVYEAMYERAPNAPVVANNLASLISAYRDDDDSLERAYTIARRLRGSDVAAFADTYGWIAFRRGNLDEALEHLERAANGLPGDPLVQFHYARALAEDGQAEAALTRFRRAVDLAGTEDTRAQFDTARREIARLEAEIAGQSDDAEEQSGGDN